MKALYTEILKALAIYINALCGAMELCHTWGYNGHKIKYRMLIGKYKKLVLLIRNELFDMHMERVLPQGAIIPAYTPKDMKEHSYEWVKVVGGTLAAITAPWVKIAGMTGVYKGPIAKAVKKLYKEQEKARRWVARAEILEWQGHDMHRQDDAMHDKYKRKEARKKAKG